MTKHRIKLGLIAVMLLSIASGASGSAFRAKAYPELLKKAGKFGAKDCLFCHKREQGGEGWNARGQWLLDEKERRKSDAVDVDWLEDYKEPDKEKKKEGGTEHGR